MRAASTTMEMELKKSRIEEESIEKFAMANCVNIMKKNELLGRCKLFECKKCKKRFESFQALGGHSTCHKDRKNKVMSTNDVSLPINSKKHQCNLCGKVFATGQALGGHMRKHRDELSQTEQQKNESKGGESSKALEIKKDLDGRRRILFLDLNLTPYENELRQK